MFCVALSGKMIRQRDMGNIECSRTKKSLGTASYSEPLCFFSVPELWMFSPWATTSVSVFSMHKHYKKVSEMGRQGKGPRQ